MASTGLQLLFELKVQNKEILTLLSEVTKSLKNIESAGGTAGKSMNAGFTLAVAAGNLLSRGISELITLSSRLAKEALFIGMNFEQSMSGVKAITKASEFQMQTLTEAAREWGKTTVFSAQQVANTMEILAKAGFSTNEIMGAIPGTLDLAAAGSMSLAQAADIAASAIRTFGLNATDMGRVSDLLAYAASKANTTVEELGLALKYTGPYARQLGFDIGEVIGVMAKMGDMGIRASMAGVTLRRAFQSLVKPVGEAEEVLKKYKIEVRDLENGGFKPLVQILNEFRAAGMSAKEIFTVLGIRGAGFASILNMDKEKLDAFFESLKDVTGFAGGVARDRLNNLKGDIVLLKSAFSELSILLYTEVSPALRNAVQSMTSFLNSTTGDWSKISENAKVVWFAFKEIIDFIKEEAIFALRQLAGVFITITAEMYDVLAPILRLLGIEVPEKIIFVASAMNKLETALEQGKQAVKDYWESWKAAKIVDELQKSGTDKQGYFGAIFNGLVASIPQAKELGKSIFDLGAKAVAGAKVVAKAVIEQIKKPLEDTNQVAKEFDFSKINKEVLLLKESLKETNDQARIYDGLMVGIGKVTTESGKKIQDAIQKIIEIHFKEGGSLANWADENNKAYTTAIHLVEMLKKEMEEQEKITLRVKLTNAKSWHEMAEVFKKETSFMYKVWGEVMLGIEDSLTTSIGEMIKGTKSFEDAMKDLWDSVLDIFVNMLAKMLAEWILNLLVMKDTGYKINIFEGLMGGIGSLIGGVTGLLSKIPGIGGIFGAISQTFSSGNGAGAVGNLLGGLPLIGKLFPGAASTGGALGTPGAVGFGMNNLLGSSASTGGSSFFGAITGGMDKMFASMTAGISKIFPSILGGSGTGLLSLLGPIGIGAGLISLLGGFGKEHESLQDQAGGYLRGMQAEGMNPQALSGMGNLQDVQGQRLIEEGIYVQLGERLKAFGVTLQDFANGTATSEQVIATAKDALIQHLVDTGGKFNELDQNLIGTIELLGGTVTNADIFNAAVQSLGFQLDATGNVVDANGNKIQDFGFKLDAAGNVVDIATGKVLNFNSAEELFAAITNGATGSLNNLSGAERRVGADAGNASGRLNPLSGMMIQLGNAGSTAASGIQGAISALNTNINSINGIRIPSPIIRIGAMAEGGISANPMLTTFAENEPELALPLSKAPEVLAKTLLEAGMGTLGQIINVNLNGNMMFRGDDTEFDEWWRRGFQRAAVRNGDI